MVVSRSARLLFQGFEMFILIHPKHGSYHTNIGKSPLTIIIIVYNGLEKNKRGSDFLERRRGSSPSKSDYNFTAWALIRWLSHLGDV